MMQFWQFFSGACLTKLSMASDSTAVSTEIALGRTKLQLYSFCRSSCSWRVRIALNLKGLEYAYKAVDIYKGEQFSPEFSKLNPLGFVPVLVDDDVVISDSFAIILYLEEKYPENPLLPRELQKRALNFQAASIVCSSIQPYQSIGALSYIEEKINYDEQFSWVRHHIGKGFTALEKLLKGFAGRYATGDEVFLADLFLAPQIHAAEKRFNLDLSEFPLLCRLSKAYDELPAFRAAMPDMQPDAVKL